MKPVKDAKVTVKGLGEPELEELDGESVPISTTQPPASSRSINAPAPRSADAARTAGRYTHVPPRRVTRSMTKATPGAEGAGDTLRPPSSPDLGTSGQEE